MKTPPLEHGRRLRYQAPLHNADFFIVRHLGRFLEADAVGRVAAGCRVADIGCGEQPLRGAIESRGGKYTGIDVARNAAGTVQALARADRLPLKPGAFDLVLCTEVLEHVPDQRAAFAELAGLLAPGARLVVTTPFLYPLHEEPWDFARLTVHQLRHLAQSHGLQAEMVEALGNEFEVIATMWCRIWMPAGPGGGRAMLPLRVLFAAMRLAGNAAALVAGSLFGKLLSRRAYLSSVCVLTRPRSAVTTP